jgi:hypothetical protein
MRTLLPAIALVLSGCGGEPGPIPDAPAPRDTSSVDTTQPSDDGGDDAGFDDSCDPGDPVPWLCVSSGAVGPSCGDVRFPPSCMEGTWRCPFAPGSLMPDRTGMCVCFGGPRPLTQHCTCTDGGTVSCTFDCGTEQCDLDSEYCAVTASDVGGEPDSHVCTPFVDPCTGSGCDCIGAGSISCETEVGATTARYPGG